MKILLAEDTIDLNRVETAVLKHEGYDVDSVFDGVQAETALLENGYDLVILDIMMPKKSGMEVLSAMRARNDITPVLLLTAKTGVDDRVEGLDSGADDYLTKPFAMKELLARVRAMTRRRSSYTTKVLAYGDFRLDDDTFELAGENSVRLSVKEFSLLQTLILQAGHEIDTNYLLTHVWDDTEDATIDTVWLYISYLRAKLNAVSSRVRIEGMRGGSFRLTEGNEQV